MRKPFSEWMYDCINRGHCCVAITRPAEECDVYSDNTQVINAVNIGWQDTTTGEVYWLYEDEDNADG